MQQQIQQAQRGMAIGTSKLPLSVGMVMAKWYDVTLSETLAVLDFLQISQCGEAKQRLRQNRIG